MLLPILACFYTTGRWLIDKFRSTLPVNEGCVVVKTLASVVISVAEKAVALQLKTPIAAETTLKDEERTATAEALNSDDHKIELIRCEL